MTSQENEMAVDHTLSRARKHPDDDELSLFECSCGEWSCVSDRTTSRTEAVSSAHQGHVERATET